MTMNGLSSFRITLLSAAGSALLGMGLGVLIKQRQGISPDPQPVETGLPDPVKLPEPSSRVLALLNFVRQARSPDARMAAALRLAEEVESEEECRGLLENLNRFPAMEAEDMVVSVVLRRWLELDSAGAVAWCARHRPAFAARLTGSLTLSDPDKAQAALASLPPGRVLDAARHEFAAGLVTADPDRAWEFLKFFPFPDLLPDLVAGDVAGTRARLENMAPALQNAAAEAMVTEWMKTEPDAAWDWGRRQPDSGTLQRVMIMAAFASSPAVACRLLGSLPPDAALDLMRNSRRNWQSGDLSAAVRALEQDRILDGYVKEAVLMAAYERAEKENPAVAKSFLDLWSTLRSANQERHKALMLQKNQEKGLSASGGVAPEEARSAPEEMAGDDLREEMAGMNWKYKDSLWRNYTKSAGQETVKALPPDSPESLLENLEWHQFPKPGDPRIRQLSLESFGELLGRPDASHAQNAVFDGMMRQKPEMAATWLETAPLSEQAGFRAARFAANWASEEPAAAAAWVSRLPAGELAENAAANVARPYHACAPAAACGWAASLPPGPVREAAVKAMKE